MELRPDPKPNSPHKYEVELTPEESEVFAAAYAEYLLELVKSGNAASINERFDPIVASWEHSSHTFRASSVAPVTDVLNNFIERTNQVIASLPETTRTPAFRNKDIGLRKQLGTRAVGVVKDLADKQAMIELGFDLESLPETHERS